MELRRCRETCAARRLARRPWRREAATGLRSFILVDVFTPSGIPDWIMLRRPFLEKPAILPFMRRAIAASCGWRSRLSNDGDPTARARDESLRDLCRERSRELVSASS